MTGTNVQGEAAKLFGWWAGELARVSSPPRPVAKPWRGMLLGAGQGFEVYVRQGRSTQHLGRLDPAEGGEEAGKIVAQLRSKGVSDEHLVLRLSPAEVLATQRTLPAGVRDMLGLVVRNQLERVAPWPADQALFAYEPVAGAQGDAQINVNVWVTSRAQVERTLAELAVLGLRPRVVDSAPSMEEEPRFNLIGRGEQDFGKRSQTIARTLTMGAAAAAVLSLCCFGYVYHLGERQAAQEQIIQRDLQAATAASRPQDAEVQRQRAFVIEQRSKALPVSIALEALSRALPDDAFLERIELRNGVITFSGKAQSVAGLIGPLEAVRHFEQVQFAAPTTRKEGEPREEFSLSVRLKPALSLDAARQP